MIAVKRQNKWAVHYAEEVEQSIEYYNLINQLMPVWTRPLDEEEKKELFGGNPDYIKKIGHQTDSKEWKWMK